MNCSDIVIFHFFITLSFQHMTESEKIPEDNIAVIGCGYVGLLTGTVIASKNQNHVVTLLDIDDNKIEMLRRKQHYLNERGFAEIFSNLDNVKLTTHYEDISDASVIIVVVNTPDNNGKCNMTYLYSTIDYINRFAKYDAIVVIKSTVEVGTTSDLYRNKLRKDLYVFNIPEFLAEGEAIRNLLDPIRVLIGYTDTTKERYEEKLEQLRSIFHYVDPERVVVTDSNTSELIKLSSNFMLAQRVASINAIEYVAKTKHANIVDISRILRMDPRIGTTFLSPSAGFGGSCFRKDINNLSNITSDSFYKSYFKSINVVNDYHMIQIAESIPNNTSVLFLGYGFKETTEDTRESPCQFIIDYLNRSIHYEVYDQNIDRYDDRSVLSKHYDTIVILNNESSYVDIVNKYTEQFPETTVINPKYIPEVITRY